MLQSHGTVAQQLATARFRCEPNAAGELERGRGAAGLDGVLRGWGHAGARHARRALPHCK